MDDDHIDRLLAAPDVIEPSPGFSAAVMDAVRADAAASGAIPFPWWLALPGFGSLCLLLTASAFSALNPSGAETTLPLPSDLVGSLLLAIVEAGTSATAASAVLAVVLGWLSVHLSMRLVRPTL